MLKKIKKIIKSESGFTLIELLVVIGIIAVLATIGTIAFGNAASRSRDAKRQADLRTLSSGLQIYNTKKGRYPMSSDTDEWGEFLGELGISGARPPKSENDYCYYLNEYSGTSFTLVATDFENTIPTDAITNQTPTQGYSFEVDTDSDGDGYTTVCIGHSNGLACQAANCSGSTCNGNGFDYCIGGSSGALFED